MSSFANFTKKYTKGILFASLTCSAFCIASAQDRPNILFILVDDMGYSDLGCYGGEIDTPNIDSLAASGIRFNGMYNTAKCHSSRACLLTGIYAQQSGNGPKHSTYKNAVTLGEVLRTAGYRTWASGKHHSLENLYDRGFDHYYGVRDGGCNFWNPGEKRPGEPEPGRKETVRYWCDDEKTYHPYTPQDKNFYTTDAFTDKALQWLDEESDKPFFLYLAYTAPHYPLHAWPEDIAKYKGRFDGGYEAVQQARYERMVEMGIIDPEKAPLPEWTEKRWDSLSGEELEKEKRRMEIYAAMLDRADQNIGRVLAKLKEQGKLENTLIMFASDNGACAEPSRAAVRSTRIEDFGTVASYETVGQAWATVQNTPLRYWKTYTHEGGIRTPFIINWPGKIKNAGGFYHGTAHFIDIMATLVELTGATYPDTFNGEPVVPMQGISLLPAFDNKPLVRNKPLFWQFGRGGGVRDGNMKAVYYRKKWELFDLENDRNESHDLANQYPERLATMKAMYDTWFKSVRKGQNKSKKER